MQTLTFVCRQDLGIWIMHCYSWIGPYRDTAACVCSAQCVFRTHCECSLSACQCISPWLRLLRDCFVRGGKVKGTVHPKLTAKKPCRWLQVCFKEHSVSSLLHFLGVLCTHKQDFRWVKERISQNSFQAERPQCWHLDSRKGGWGGISTSEWAPSSYLFDMRPWDTSVLFTWGNILQWLRKAKHCCVNVAILAFVVCFHVHTPGLRAKRRLVNRAVVSPVLGQQSGYGSRRHAEECAPFSC